MCVRERERESVCMCVCMCVRCRQPQYISQAPIGLLVQATTCAGMSTSVYLFLKICKFASTKQNFQTTNSHCTLKQCAEEEQEGGQKENYSLQLFGN